MGSTIIKKEKNIVTLEFTISKENFEKAVNEAYLKLKDKIAVQGFRKGKAPKHIIERKYGKGIFNEDALDIAVNEAYPIAVKENNLDVIDSPKLSIVKFEEGEDIVMSADVQVMPEVELGEYKGVEVERFEIKVTDDDVQKELERIQEQNARIIEVTDRPVQNGDTLTIDYAGFVGEEQFEGGTAENQALEIGSNSFIPGFEEQLVGKNKDEEVEINVTFPEEYHAENLKGKEAIFKVKIHEIKAKELPEIDDEFAKDVSEFDTLEELKADTRKSLEQKAIDSAKITNDNNIITKVVKNANVEIPEVLIDREIEYLARNYEQQFRNQGFAGKEVEDLIKSFVEQYKQSAREQAEFNVKADLVLKAIIEKEKIEATEEELNDEAEKLVASYNVEEDKKENFKKSILESSKNYIQETIQKNKAIEMLVENAILADKVEEEVSEEVTEEVTEEEKIEQEDVKPE
ncbi:MAG: trigger factor [Tissierellia bacterium]|nr:trigger factor [Tissierellia bacterium]MDD4779836.1 trigger factor [Tissierellia bacterium]